MFDVELQAAKFATLQIAIIKLTGGQKEKGSVVEVLEE